MEPDKFFTKDEKEKILQAIKEAEKNTSGEIRVHIENRCPGDVLDRAAFIFEKLGMHKTKDRNGVLFYIAIGDRKFAVIGDAGINAVVPSDFWDSIKTIMEEHFKNMEFTDGLIKGITETGKKLKEFFPHMPDDINELPDEISFSKY